MIVLYYVSQACKYPDGPLFGIPWLNMPEMTGWASTFCPPDVRLVGVTGP